VRKRTAPVVVPVATVVAAAAAATVVGTVVGTVVAFVGAGGDTIVVVEVEEDEDTVVVVDDIDCGSNASNGGATINTPVRGERISTMVPTSAK